MSTWAVMLVIGIGSYVLRVVPILAGARITPRLESHLGRAGTAALTALVAGDLAVAPSWSLAAAGVAAVLVGALVAIRGGSMLRVVVAGVAVHVVVTAALSML